MMDIRVDPSLNFDLANEFGIFGEHWIKLPCEIVEIIDVEGVEVARCKMDLSFYGLNVAPIANIPTAILALVDVN